MEVRVGEDMAAEGEAATMPRRRRRTAGSHRSRRRSRRKDRRGGDLGSGAGWLAARRRGIWLVGEGRGRGIQDGGTVEGCGLGTTTGRGARDGEPVGGRGVGGARSRVVGMRARGSGARVGGDGRWMGEGDTSTYDGSYFPVTCVDWNTIRYLL